MNGSPLGRYAAIGALAATLGTLTAAILYRILSLALTGEAASDATLDGWAYLSLGVLFGQQLGVWGGRQEGQSAAASTINGLARKTEAAHERLDRLEGRGG